MAGPWFLFASLAMAQLSSASFFPAPVQGVNNKTTTFDPRISVSSKDTSSLCETTPNVRSYSGYVSMSPESLEFVNGLPGFPVNSFYWFFESRNDPKNDPFVLWLGGGPGFSSIISATYENGPCNVGADSNSTTLNPFSWNNNANIIYLDSPVMTGFSYNTLVNSTIDGFNATLPITAAAATATSLPDGNTTFQVGTFSNQDPTQTSNSTGNTVPVIWTAMQAWFANFPQYKPANGRMSIWGESYGGRYVPLTAEFFLDQNQGIANGTIKNATTLNIDTVGTVNGYSDPKLHVTGSAAFVNNNTYGIQTVSPQVQQAMQNNLTKSGGCLDLLDACDAATNGSDVQDAATNKTSDQVCAEAFEACETGVQLLYNQFSGRGQFDITHQTLDPFPAPFPFGFVNQPWVQQALGVPVNFTTNSAPVLAAFEATGDLARSGARQALGRLLDAGTQVAMVYGDRDYQVNWIGGEQVSLNVQYSQSSAFVSAGYANMMASNGIQGGVTRQVGNFSFTRVFEAGHEVAAYQPQVALDIFNRAMNHTDIATGTTSTTGGASAGNSTMGIAGLGNSTMFMTQGPTSSFAIKNVPGPMPQSVCYTWEIGLSCPPEQVQWLKQGTAIVKNFVVVGNNNGTNGTSGAAGAKTATSAASRTALGAGAAAGWAMTVGLGMMLAHFA